MILEATATLPAKAIAKAIAVAVVKGDWVSEVKTHALQRKPASDDLPAWADAGCLSAPFLFRFETGDPALPGNVHVLDNARLRSGARKMLALDPIAFNRIAGEAPTVSDASTFLQLCLFGHMRY